MNGTKYFFQDRAALMRSAAESAETPQFHTARLRAATGYDALAEKAEREKTRDEKPKQLFFAWGLRLLTGCLPMSDNLAGLTKYHHYSLLRLIYKSRLGGFECD